MHYSLISGVSIAIINNFKIDTLIALGVKDNQTKEPMTVNTLLMAGSISKPIASICAMSFVQHGDIKLNDNVNVVLQSWKMPDNEYTVNQKVTLHRLLSHRAGTIEGSYQYSNDKPIPTLLQVLNGESPAVNPPVEVTFVPGSEFIYSNLGYCVIEQILTDITGKPFYEIVKQTVFDPLNMNNSSFEQLLPAQRENNYSSGHYTLGSVVPGKYMITSNIAAGGI